MPPAFQPLGGAALAAGSDRSPSPPLGRSASPALGSPPLSPSHTASSRNLHTSPMMQLGPFASKIDGDRSRGLSFAQSVAANPGRCSIAFRSSVPRFTPGRTFSGQDPRALLAEDPFRGQHPYQYQSPRAYKQTFRHGHALSAPKDSFRYGVVVREPLRAMSPFQSSLPRLTATRPLEPLRRATYGPELNCRAYTYLPL